MSTMQNIQQAKVLQDRIYRLLKSRTEDLNDTELALHQQQLLQKFYGLSKTVQIRVEATIWGSSINRLDLSNLALTAQDLLNTADLLKLTSVTELVLCESRLFKLDTENFTASDDDLSDDDQQLVPITWRERWPQVRTKVTDKLVEFLSRLPTSITALNLARNDLFELGPYEFTRIINNLPANILTLNIRGNGLRSVYNSTLTDVQIKEAFKPLAGSGIHLIMHENGFSDELTHEINYLVTRNDLKIRALFEDYAKDSWFNFFVHPNRHHRNSVLNALTEDPQQLLSTLQQIREKARATGEFNETGSFARRLNYIENHVLNPDSQAINVDYEKILRKQSFV